MTIKAGFFRSLSWGFLASLLTVSCSAPLKTSTPVPAQQQELPSLGRYSVDDSGITISGMSAGAFLAVQVQLSHSSLVSGVGTVAGGVYGCSEGSYEHGLDFCMFNPSKIQVRKYVKKAREDASKGRLDSLANLKRARVFIVSGQKDPVVRPGAASKLKQFYTAFAPEKNIVIKTDLPAGHVFPTIDQGAACEATSPPWLGKCGFDTAGAFLKHFYGALKPPVASRPENLLPFNQKEFFQGDIGFHHEGYVYVPTGCKPEPGTPPVKSRCRLHVALHGCLQSQDQVKDAFRAHAGYNEWAEANNIIVLYPSGKEEVYPNTNRTDVPPACFDWWGYTGKDHLDKNAPQVQAVRAMIDRIRGADL